MIQFILAFNSVFLILVYIAVIKNIFFLLLNPFYTIKKLIRIKKYSALKDYNPKVSIIVPAWNEGVGIISTVESILANTYQNLEVVIINDGSTDNSHNIIKEFLGKITNKEKRGKIIYLIQPNSGKGKALNKGIKKSTGQLILTCDADSILEKNAVENLIKYYIDTKIMAVVGNVKVTNTSTPTGIMQRIEYLFSFYNKRAHCVLGAEYIFGGACASFRRGVFDEIGFFDEINKTEDIDMSMRTRIHGMECTYGEDVICYTEGASKLGDLIRQRTRWKKGRFDAFYTYRKFFFSFHPSHNKFLTWMILPMSMVTELQLLLEPIAVTFFVLISIYSGDFITIFIGLLFMMMSYVIYGLFNSDKINFRLILSFPFTWISFYILNWVEYFALLNSIKLLVTKKNIIWQKWDRKGIR